MPYILVTTQIRVECGPTYVGDEDSDPALMRSLGAQLIQEPGNNFSAYVTTFKVRKVLDLLEKNGYTVVGMSGMGQTCVWTMNKLTSKVCFLMAKVHIINVAVLDNPSAFFNPFQFEITFECVEDLEEDLEWRIIYVGSAESEAFDQVLDTVYVGPVPEGRHMFVFQADAPDPAKIPVGDVVGVTVLLLTCSYRTHEFIRVGYYINNDYADVELRETPPTIPQFDKLQRNILASNPRVTRFMIDWGDTNSKQSNNKNDLEQQEEDSPMLPSNNGLNGNSGSCSNEFSS